LKAENLFQFFSFLVLRPNAKKFKTWTFIWLGLTKKKCVNCNARYKYEKKNQLSLEAKSQNLLAEENLLDFSNTGKYASSTQEGVKSY